MRIKADLNLAKLAGVYEPGDWVVLGMSGRGWSPALTGSVVQIADIGPHLHGTLYNPIYDFYAVRNSTIPRGAQIIRGDSTGGGCSARILRHASAAEIARITR